MDSGETGEPEQRGSSLLEFVVVIVLACIFIMVFLDRVLLYQELAEKTAAEITVLNMRAGLRYRTAEMLLRHQEAGIINLVGGNPVKCLDRPPPNYIGELSQPRWEDVPPGSWYFDTGKGEMLYRVKRTRYFVPGPRGQHGLRFRVTAVLRKAHADSPMFFAEGVNLTLLEQYNWLDGDK